MKLEFDEAKHVYRLDGQTCPSVTQICDVLSKPGMGWWGYGLAINGVLEVLRQCTVDPDYQGTEQRLKTALNALRYSPNAVLQDTAKRGNEVHKAFVAFAGSGDMAALNGVSGYLQSLKLFLDEFKPIILDVEQRVYSPSLRVAGTYDLLAEIDGDLVLIDWKTSKKIYDSHHLQAAAYEGMRRELGKDEAQAMVVCLDKDGQEPQFAVSGATYEDFKACCMLYSMRKRIEEKEKLMKKEAKAVD